MDKLKVLTVFGTRPEAIKMAPLIKELEKYASIESVVCVTAQHRHMLDQVLNIFDIKPDFDLDIMKEKQTLLDITNRALKGINNVILQVKPNIVLVHGDTTTTFAGSLAAFYNRVCIGHVEAGLRTFDKYFPYPEEMNRRLTGVLTDIHFAPTKTNKENLINEGVCEGKIYITGNTVIDALKTTVNSNYRFQNEKLLDVDLFSKKVITVTAHRRENLGTPLYNICLAIKTIVDSYPDIEVIYPVHLNPSVQEVAIEILGNHKRIHLIDPVDVQDMHNLIARSYLIMTDSGGLQEEAPSLGKPVLVLRNETERPEAMNAGTVKLSGTQTDMIVRDVANLLDNQDEYNKMAKAINPYGDGFASERIAKALLYSFKYIDYKPDQF